MSAERLRVAVVGAGTWGEPACAHLRGARRHRAGGDRRPHARARPSRAPRRTARRPTPASSRCSSRRSPDLVTTCLPNEGHFAPDARAHPPRCAAAGREAARVQPRARPTSSIAEAEERGACSSPSTSTTATPSRCRRAYAAIQRRGAGRDRSRHLALRRRGRTRARARTRNLIETQCHGFDMLEHLAGPIASVMAQMTNKTDERGLQHDGRRRRVRQSARWAACWAPTTPPTPTPTLSTSRSTAPTGGRLIQRHGAEADPFNRRRARLTRCGGRGTSTTPPGRSRIPSTATSRTS